MSLGELMVQIITSWPTVLIRTSITNMMASMFLALCWLLSLHADGNIRILAGPLGFFHGWGIRGKTYGTIGIVILVPCMFFLGIRWNAFSLILSIVAILGWLLVALWI